MLDHGVAMIALAAVWFFYVSFDERAPLAERVYAIGPFATKQECQAAERQWAKHSMEWADEKPEDPHRNVLILNCAER